MSELNDKTIEHIIEAALFAANKTLNLEALQRLFEEPQIPEKAHIYDVLVNLKKAYEGRGIDLVEISTGFRFQVRPQVAPWVARLWEERPTRYSRALLETLAIIAYRQPITRGEIEDIRGVVVSSNIVKTLLDHEFVRVVGHREVPGRPALYATTKEFLDHFNLKGIETLPPLADLSDLDQIAQLLDGQPFIKDEQAALAQSENMQAQEEEGIQAHEHVQEIQEAEEVCSVDQTESTAENVDDLISAMIAQRKQKETETEG